MFEHAPNGYFVRDLIVFNHLRRGGFVAKGFILEAPDLTNSPIADLNDFQDQVCLLLASLQENQRLQVQYFCDSDYKDELLRYSGRRNVSRTRGPSAAATNASVATGR